jgi:hypothetical protein
MADIAPKLVSLSADKLRSLHTRLHKSELTSEVLEVHHLVLNEALRRGLEPFEKDEWDNYEIQIDFLENVDLLDLGGTLPKELVDEVIKATGTSIGSVRTVLTTTGYQLKIDPIFEPVNKMIREEDDKWVVYDKTGKSKLGEYDSKDEAEERLAQIHRFAKADNKPPKAVRASARRALDWISAGLAGDGFTSVGRFRASQLAAGESVSIDTLKRMKSFFSRHEVDKQALGFSQGEKGYPSAGRVAWDAWGGDAGFAWAESMVEQYDKVEKHNQGTHDQKTHGKWADTIAQEILNGGHPEVEPENLSALLMKMATRTDHPDITELSIQGTLLYGDEGMGIARKDMPQIPKKERARFLGDIEKSEGISVEKKQVDPTKLKPIQKEISGSRSGAIYNKFRDKGDIPKNERILISSDGYIVDGHHTWGASVAFAFDNPGTKLPVYRLSVTAKEALTVASQWAKDNGFEGQAIDAPAKKSAFIYKHLSGQHDQLAHGAWAGNTVGEIPAMAKDVPAEAGRNPEAVAIAKTLRNEFLRIEPAITKTMTDLASNVGASMDGLKDRVKSTDSLARKIEDDSRNDGVIFQEAAGQISDGVRYTMIFDEADYTAGVKRVGEQLTADGYSPRIKNFWREGDPYQGINIKATKNGVTAELQLHTPKSLEIKKAIHPIYKLETKETNPQAKYKLYMQEVRYARRIPFPDNRNLLSTIGVQSFQAFQTPRQAQLVKTTKVDIIQMTEEADL